MNPLLPGSLGDLLESFGVIGILNCLAPGQLRRRFGEFKYTAGLLGRPQ